jgi:hypothetical protein
MASIETEMSSVVLFPIQVKFFSERLLLIWLKMFKKRAV